LKILKKLELVLDLLKEYTLYNFVTEGFTKKLEKTMGLIEIGKKDYKL